MTETLMLGLASQTERRGWMDAAQSRTAAAGDTSRISQRAIRATRHQQHNITKDDWLSFRRVGQAAIRLDLRRRIQLCLFDLPWPQHVEHALAGGKQVIGDDPAVASPPQCLRAHDGAP